MTRFLLANMVGLGGRRAGLSGLDDPGAVGMLELLRRLKRYRHILSPVDAWRANNSGRGLFAIHPKGLNSPIWLRRGTTDLSCFDKVFLNRDYECPFEVEPKFIVDAGANIGIATLYFTARYPGAIVAALEPEPDNFRLLKRNCENLEHLIAMEAALWPKTEQVKLTESIDGEAWSFTVHREDRKVLKAVDGFSVPHVMEIAQRDHIDILKVDIEGSERVLFEAEDTSWLDRVSILVIELHDRFEPGCANAVYSKLVGRNFHQEIRGENIFIRLWK